MEIFADEILRIPCSEDNSDWTYIGLLFVPLKKKEELLKFLMDLRCIKYKKWHNDVAMCSQKCGYHEKNNTEIHYSALKRTNARYRIAKEWIEFIINKALPRGYLNFNILGLNLSKMNLKLFGEKKGSYYNIYNRFFRSIVKGSLNYFYKDYEKIIINKIYHDKGGQQNHRFFPWHLMYKLGSEIKRLEFNSNEVEFIDSDHRKSKMEESHFIQLIDLILGATLINLHGQSQNEEQRKIGLIFQPALKTIIDRKKSKSGWYGKYYKSKFKHKCAISFFPDEKVNLDRKNTQNDLFGNLTRTVINEKYYYYNRKILLKGKEPPNLNKWLINTEKIKSK